MWRLSKLDIKGFKSFADAAQLVFPEGITAVVGPNGCGKSNISDAIVWALGEQSTSALRAQQMKDVIFQGSAGRKARGAAEVTLHLTTRPDPNLPAVVVTDDGIDIAEPAAVPVVNGNGSANGVHTGNGNGATAAAANGAANGASNGAVNGAPNGALNSAANGTAGADDEEPHVDSHFPLDELPDEELAITRRLLRSGDSEYLLNGQKCLLREIRERLLGTGLGFRACFTIGQGKIDQILSASPLERRAPIEEAAGISLYRRRRHTTNLKLEATAQDLARVQDICDEVARQMRSLKRQAGRAKKYRELREKLRGLERFWFSAKLREADSAAHVSKASLQATSLAEEEAREGLELATRAWEGARRKWREQRQEETRRQQKLYNAQVQQERCRSEAARQKDRAVFARQRSDELTRKLVELDERRLEDASLLDVRRRASAEADDAARAAERLLQEANERLDPITHLDTPDDSEAQRQAEGRSLVLRPLAARIEVEAAARGAVALALGRALTMPLLQDEELDAWLEAMGERRGVSHGLRGPGTVAETTPIDDDAVVGPLRAQVTCDDDTVARVLDRLLVDHWVVNDVASALRLAHAHADAAFVDTSGTVWASGPEIRYRNEAGEVDTIAASARAEQRIRLADPDDPEPQATPVVDQEAEAAKLRAERAEAELRAARAQAVAAAREVQVAESALRRRDDEIARLKAEAKNLERTAVDATQRTQRAEEEADLAAVACKQLEAEVAEQVSADVSEEAELAGLEICVTSRREQLEKIQTRRSAAEVAAAELRVNSNHLYAQVRERLSMEPAELLRDVAEHEEKDGATPPPLTELDREIRKVRGGIDRIGPVNLVAYEDFEEQKERFDDLDGQRRDLVGAAANLREAIRKIDGDCVQRFADAFEAIDTYFNRIFRQLFGGGRAGMRLEDPDDPLNSGIEIVAQAPGKTLQSIRLMSGGERSLIALALMFAIFEYHPAPFCILDEADAALDERNVGRFVQALHHFQDRAQFIMITHNKRSMEIADLLYGVTMEETGVSKLVSVQLH